MHIRAIYIEIFGRCNLRCNLCPQGRLTPRGYRALGRMSPEVFDKVARSLRHQKGPLPCIRLYNWGEPTLHPHLGHLIDIAGRYDFAVEFSSNLVKMPEPSRFLRPNLHSVYISMSGFSNQTYGVNHIGGSFSRVAQNMKRLGKSVRHAESPTKLELRFHVYRYNLRELPEAGAFCREWGIHFKPYYGSLGSLEGFRTFFGTDASRKANRFREYVHDHVFLEQVAANTLGGRAAEVCPQEEVLTIGWDGSVMTCCAVWEDPGARPKIWEADLTEYAATRTENEVCRLCKSRGWAADLNSAPEPYETEST